MGCQDYALDHARFADPNSAATTWLVIRAMALAPFTLLLAGWLADNARILAIQHTMGRLHRFDRDIACIFSSSIPNVPVSKKS